MTGANTGIGRETVLALAGRGARVFLAGRSESKTRPVIDEIVAQTGNGDLEFLALDLGDLGSVRAGADEFLRTGELFSRLCADGAFGFNSNNAPEVVDVLGTLLLSILCGHSRYAHINALRFDTVTPPILGMNKVVSEDSARRSLKRLDQIGARSWQGRHLRATWEPLLYEPWVLDIDTTIKTIYGHQQGAQVGYNPHKPGRPSHTYHTYWIGRLRLCLDVEVRPGKEHAGKYGMPGLWELIDSLPRVAWPQMIRGDCNYGNEENMREAEGRGLCYLFKLRQTQKAKELILFLESRGGWSDAGQGWEGIEGSLQLTGWSCKRVSSSPARQTRRAEPNQIGAAVVGTGGRLQLRESHLPIHGAGHLAALRDCVGHATLPGESRCGKPL